MIKINHDKLTDFERQLAVMFELKLPGVGVSDNRFQVPGMPAIQLHGWPRASMVPPEPGIYDKKIAVATWYRRLSWRGQILMHQLHRRALERPIEDAKAETHDAEPVKVGPIAPLLTTQQMQAIKNNAHHQAMNRLPNLYNPGAAQAVFYNGVPLQDFINEMIQAGATAAEVATFKKGLKLDPNLHGRLNHLRDSMNNLKNSFTG